jgi:dCMP deaminase
VLIGDQLVKDKFITVYLNVAQQFAQLSPAQRLKVGAIVVKQDRIISIGFNGTPTGWDNNCEYRDYCIERDFNGNYFPGTEDEYPLEDERGRYRLKTRPEVLHAEMNALMKLARSNESGEAATMFITHSPCLECAKGIFQAGIKSVYYRNQYRNNDGIDFLHRCGIDVQQINDNTQ